MGFLLPFSLEFVVLHLQFNDSFAEPFKLFLLEVGLLFELDDHIKKLLNLLFGAGNLGVVFLHNESDFVLILLLEDPP